MQCLRCDGLMVSDEFYSRQNYFNGVRCLICGEILDPMILTNRLGVGAMLGARTEARSENPQKQLTRFKEKE